MKILSLTAENVKKLVAIEVIPTGNVVTLTGKNGSGKTSVLDCISWAFEGLAKVQDKPIRFGENKAWIKIDLGDYVVERTFKTTDKGDTTSAITVTSKDGSVFKQPQTLLDTVFGQLSFDPLKFSRADKKEQVALLESLVPNFDFKKSRVEEQLAYDERTAANRNAKNWSTTHMSFVDVPVPEPEKVDIAGLTAQMARASEVNVEIEKQKSQRAKEAKEKITDKVETKNRLAKEYGEAAKAASLAFENAKEALNIAEGIFAKAKDAFEEAKKQQLVNTQVLESYEKEISQANDAHKALPPLADPIDISAIKAQLDAATAKNALHEKWVKKAEAKKAVDEYEKQSADLTEKIAALQMARYNAVANAGLPVAGLGFDADGVSLNGVPFEQCSSGEQLRVSVALAMLSNPKLRVIRVNDGSLLDDDGIALLTKMAKDQDYQIWVEMLTPGVNSSILLEEGRIIEKTV